ncbi:MAG: RNA polymerase sigma factor [bacterium]
MTESYAIRLCMKHQDPRGFEFLVKKYRREAFFHATVLLGNHEDAKDACQESFTKAFVAIPRLRQLDFFYPWFYTILRNCCLNMIRRKKTSEKYRQNNPGGAENETEHINPSILLEQKEDRITVWQVLRALNPEFREILVMKYIQDLCYEDISRNLGIPRGTVMSRLYYARKAFREKYHKIDRVKDKSRKESMK